MSRAKEIVCYHVSSIAKRNFILENGLIPKAKTEGSIKYEPRLFFSTDKTQLGFDYVDYFNVDVWKFEISEEFIKRDENTLFECFCYTNQKINKHKIKLVETVV